VQSTCQVDFSQQYSSNFYAIVTDYTRVLAGVSIPPTLYDILMDILLDFDSSVIPVLVFLIIFNLVMPIVASCRDRHAYNLIQKFEGEDDITEEFLRRIA
jgi:uncharacterized membrane protein